MTCNKPFTITKVFIMLPSPFYTLYICISCTYKFKHISQFVHSALSVLSHGLAHRHLFQHCESEALLQTYEYSMATGSMPIVNVSNVRAHKAACYSLV